MRATAQDVDARGVHVHLVAEHAGHRVHHGQQAVFLENGAQRVDVVEHAAGRVAVHERGVLEVVIFRKKRPHRLGLDRPAHVGGQQHGSAAVQRHKVRKALAVDAVVQHQHAVARLGQAGHGGLQTEDALAAEQEGFVLRVQESGVFCAGVVIECVEIRVKVGVGRLLRAGEQHVLAHLGGAGGEQVVHDLRLPQCS